MCQYIEELTALSSENVWDLSEEDVFSLLQTLQKDYERTECDRYMKIIGSAFDFRSISKKRRDLKESLTSYGFKFFKADENASLLTGICKRKKAGKSLF